MLPQQTHWRLCTLRDRGRSYAALAVWLGSQMQTEHKGRCTWKSCRACSFQQAQSHVLRICLPIEVHTCTHTPSSKEQRWTYLYWQAKFTRELLSFNKLSPLKQPWKSNETQTKKNQKKNKKNRHYMYGHSQPDKWLLGKNKLLN